MSTKTKPLPKVTQHDFRNGDVCWRCGVERAYDPMRWRQGDGLWRDGPPPERCEA